MAESKKENYSEKFKDLMGEENLYEFFLKMQNLMPKYSKKKILNISLLLLLY